jgi:hypothetical protein
MSITDESTSTSYILFVDYESMQFSLAPAGLGKHPPPLSKSSASCPAEPSVSNEDKGLIAVGVVRGVLIFVLVALALHKILTREIL